MMHFDETGTYVKSEDIHNNKSNVIDDQMSNYSNRMCKSKCLQYKATKPITHSKKTTFLSHMFINR